MLIIFQTLQRRLGFFLRFFDPIPKKYLYGLAAFIVVMLLFTIFGGRGLIKIYQLKLDREKIQLANTRLSEENKKIIEQINKVKNNKEEIEKIAREELGLVKKGEVVYQFEK